LAIKQAKMMTGDYKLKSDKDYIVPEEKRMNVSKKRKNMFILEEYLYSLKMKFNNSVKRLRLEKEELINLITESNKKI